MLRRQQAAGCVGAGVLTDVSSCRDPAGLRAGMQAHIYFLHHCWPAMARSISYVVLLYTEQGKAPPATPSGAAGPRTALLPQHTCVVCQAGLSVCVRLPSHPRACVWLLPHGALVRVSLLAAGCVLFVISW